MVGKKDLIYIYVCVCIKEIIIIIFFFSYLTEEKEVEATASATGGRGEGRTLIASLPLYHRLIIFGRLRPEEPNLLEDEWSSASFQEEQFEPQAATVHVFQEVARERKQWHS